MLMVLMAAVTPAPPVPPGLAVAGGLVGCWQVAGQVRGRDAASIARGEWHLGRRYVTLHLRTTGARAYEAAITFGAGERPQAIGSVFSDTFGGMYEPSFGAGETEATGFVQQYRFPDAIYVNRFVRVAGGWHWTITERSAGKADSLFADYHLRPASCRSMRFAW